MEGNVQVLDFKEMWTEQIPHMLRWRKMVDAILSTSKLVQPCGTNVHIRYEKLKLYLFIFIVFNFTTFAV